MQIFPKKLVPKFLLFFILISLISLCIFIYSFLSVTGPMAKKQATIDLSLSANNIALELKSQLAIAETLAFSLAKIGEQLSKKPDQDKKLLRHLLSFSENNPYIAGGGVWPEPFAYNIEKRYASFFWAKDKDSKFKFFDDYNQEDSVSYHNEQWYVPSKYTKKNRAFWSNSYIDPYSKEPMVTVTVPMYDEEKFIGVSTVDVKLTGLDFLLSQQTKVFNGYAILVDSGGKFLSHPDKQNAQISHNYITSSQYARKVQSFQSINKYIETSLQGLSSNANNIDLKLELIGQMNDISKRDIHIISKLISSPSIGISKLKYLYNLNTPHTQELSDVVIMDFQNTHWKLIIFIPHSYIYKNSNEILETLLLSFSIIFILLFLLSIFILRKLLINPISKLNYEIKAIANQNNPLQYLSVLGEDELSELATHFNAHSKLLYEAKDKIASALQAKSDFLANMSHEVRTPMNAVLGFINILYKAETDTKKLEQLKIIKNAGESLLEIVNDILDFSKIESGQLDIENCAFETLNPFNSVKELCRHKAEEKGINMYITAQTDIPTFASGDSFRIKQVFSNLLSNALKFTPINGEIQIKLSLATNDFLVIEVIDNGIGIDPQNISRIFNSFEQEDISTTRKFGGTGLGLSIASKLTSMMGGEINVTSELTKGSNFSFRLPLFQDGISAEEVLKEEEQKEEISPTHYEGNILIVEDNKTNQLLLKMMLSDKGLQATVADDGSLGVDAYKKGNYDLILMDENMPNMNGITASKLIKELEKEKNTKTPIVIVTANTLKGDKEMFLAEGLDDYIAKPIDEAELDRVLSKYLTD